MTKYFLNRLLRRKIWWMDLGVGCGLSVVYFVTAVLSQNLYRETVYTMWIESFTASDIPALFYSLVPILATMAAADIYFSDQECGYSNVIFSKMDRRRYFRALYIFNFCAGGLTMLIPLALNLYLCFLVCPDRAPDLLAEGNNLVNYMGHDVLFPKLYYNYPLLHVCIHLVLGFIAAGIFATLGLAVSLFVKHKFLIWIGPYLINYVFISISSAIANGSYYDLFKVCIVHGGFQLTEIEAFTVIGVWMTVATLLYWIGVKRRGEC